MMNYKVTDTVREAVKGQILPLIFKSTLHSEVGGHLNVTRRLVIVVFRTQLFLNCMVNYTNHN